MRSSPVRPRANRAFGRPSLGEWSAFRKSPQSVKDGSTDHARSGLVSLSAANGAHRRTSLTVGDRQRLVDLIAPALQTGGHGSVGVAASGIGISRGPAARLCRIEPGLTLRPVVTLELIRRLLFLGLS